MPRQTFLLFPIAVLGRTPPPPFRNDRSESDPPDGDAEPDRCPQHNVILDHDAERNGIPACLGCTMCLTDFIERMVGQ